MIGGNEEGALSVTQTFKTKMYASATKIPLKMVADLLLGLEEGLTFQSLAERHTSVTLKEELSSTDQMTQTVYQALFQGTAVYIKDHSLPLVQTLSMVRNSLGDEAANQFLGSYVWSETGRLVEELRNMGHEAAPLLDELANLSGSV